MGKPTEGPYEVERGFRDAWSHDGGHYTVDCEHLTLYMGKDAVEDFNPDKHDWAEIHGPNQETNARLLAKSWEMRKQFEAFARDHCATYCDQRDVETDIAHTEECTLAHALLTEIEGDSK